MQPHADRPLVARTGWVVLTAVLTELVVVAGVGNQAVTNAMTGYATAPGRNLADYSRGAIDAMLTFHWRFAPRPAQPVHEWAAQFLLIGVLLALTALAVWAACRGAVAFGRVLVTVWAIVAAVTPLAIMARNLLVIPSAPGPLESRVGQSVYYYPLFGTAIVAGLALGLVTGAVAALVARLTRRPVPVRPEGPPPYDPQDHYLEDRFGGDEGPESTGRPGGPDEVAGAGRTEQLPRLGPAGHTEELPRLGPAGSTEQLPRVGEGQPTTQLPPPPFERGPLSPPGQAGPGRPGEQGGEWTPRR